MSVQLILYPQYFNGLNPISGMPLEYLVDGINFISYNTSSSVLNYASNIPQDYVAATTFTPGEWYRLSSDGTPSVESSNAITLTQFNSIYQKLSNLTIGATYDVTFNINLNVSGFTFYQYTGSVQQQATVVTGATQTITFTANSQNDTIVIDSSGALVISSISVALQTQQAPPVGNPSSGQVIVDLYEDEDIPLTLSVDNFKNAAEKVQSYSKAFKLPATKRNNRIFDNIFDVTRTVFGGGFTFNPYVKTKCELKQDGFILFEGYLRMIDITDKEGEISYNVNLYSEVIALADTLGDRKFSDLDFAELQHDYNRTQIQNSWYKSTGVTYTNSGTSGFRDEVSICYPFIDWNHSGTIADGVGAPSIDMPEYARLSDIFRPFIQVKYIIDRIFNQPDFPFTYTSEFFDTSEFKNLYMDFNWGADNSPRNSVAFSTGYYGYNAFSGGPYPQGQIALGTSFAAYQLSKDLPVLGSPVPTANYDQATNLITATSIGESYDVNYEYGFKNTNVVLARTVTVQWKLSRTTGAIEIYDLATYNILPAGTLYITGSQNFVMNAVGDTLQFQCKASATDVIQDTQAFTAASTIFGNAAATVSMHTSINSTTSNTLLQQLRGETGQWEFLKGIMTMFNLVSIPDKNDQKNILIEPYSDVFINNTNDPTSLTLAARGIAHDWTDKIDQTEIKLNVLTELNKKTIFKFVEDDDDAAFQGYKTASSGFLYGSRTWDASLFGSLETLLTGEEEITAEPFAATVIAPLMPQFPDIIVPKVYAYNADDGTSQGFDNSPRIMYRADGSSGDTDSNGIKSLPNSTYYVPAHGGVVGSNMTSYLQFSHLSGIPCDGSSYDYHFGECPLLNPVGPGTVKNLFNLYWRPYMAELYNPDTRTLVVKVNLTPGDIAEFNFYDTVFIKNRQYRVNSIEYKPNDLAVVEFILIP
jgi:hypothetical protein